MRSLITCTPYQILLGDPIHENEWVGHVAHMGEWKDGSVDGGEGRCIQGFDKET